MTDERKYQRWLEATWRGRLTPAQQAELRAWLAQHPEAQAEAETEAALNRALDLLADVPVPSNFTALVMQAAQRDPGVGKHRQGILWLAWPRRLPWLPKAAFAAVVLGVSVFSYHEVLALQRAQLARSVVAISDMASLPSPQILTNFEAIQVLERTPPADLDLLELLK